MHDALARELADYIQVEAGILDVSLRLGGKHWTVCWESRSGAKRASTVPNTPSDWRSRKNSKADIRRVLREDGDLLAKTIEDEAQEASQRAARIRAKIESFSRRRAQIELDYLAAKRKLAAEELSFGVANSPPGRADPEPPLACPPPARGWIAT